MASWVMAEHSQSAFDIVFKLGGEPNSGKPLKGRSSGRARLVG